MSKKTFSAAPKPKQQPTDDQILAFERGGAGHDTTRADKPVAKTMPDEPTKRLSLTAGVDNLFDKAYSEFVSKQDLVDVGGLIQTYRINEPGRTFWLKAQYKLD